MKSPTEIKNKIKQVKYEYLKQVYKEKLTVKPENCHYNKAVVLHDTKEFKTRLCTYYSDADGYEVCNTVTCAQRCNAFVFKHDKENLKNRLDVDVDTNPNKYPEIAVLSWVLEQKENSKITFLDKIKYEFKRFIIWVKELL
jgi:hypothetical protein